jgi:adenine deaminase
MAEAMDRLERTVAEMGVHLPRPLTFLSLLALSIVPKLKITDFSLLDAAAWKIVPVQS